MPILTTHIGTLHTLPDGSYIIEGTRDDLTLWANLPGRHWPRSALARIRPHSIVSVTFDHNGDVIDQNGVPDDILAEELDAWTDDVRKVTGHLRTGDTSD